MAAAEAYANPKIEFVWNTTLQEILGDEEVRGLILKNVVSGETREVRADGIFFFVGMVPQTEFVQNVVACDAKGYILVNEKKETSVPGIYAVGDCTQTFCVRWSPQPQTERLPLRQVSGIAGREIS